MQIGSVTGVMLAGGKSTRMGADKAFVRVGDRTLAESCVAVLRECFAQSLIIANRPALFEHFQLPVLPDDLPDLGPMGGIYTALRRVQTPMAFVVACDMPFLNADLIRDMVGAIGDCDAVAANVGGQIEPLHAVYHRRIFPAIEGRVKAGDYSVYRLLEMLVVRIFSEAELARYSDWKNTFFNVNTPEELERARRFKSQPHD